MSRSDSRDNNDFIFVRHHALSETTPAVIILHFGNLLSDAATLVNLLHFHCFNEEEKCMTTKYQVYL